MKYFDKQAILDNLTPEDVTKICIDLGSEGVRRGRNKELIFQTICHGGGSWKLYYYPEPYEKYPGKIFHCYTKCSESFGIFELVIRANRARGRNISWYQAVNYVANMSNNLIYSNHVAFKKHVIDDFNWINNFKSKEEQQVVEFELLEEFILDMFDYTPHEVFLEDNISREVLSEFEISYWGLTNQIVIPHRDCCQQLIGIRGRYLDKWEVENIGKYVPLLIEGRRLRHELGNNLYGIHINQDKIRSCKKVLLVEGEKSVMQNHTYFGQDDFSLAVCGSSITSQQIKLLLDYLGVEEIILGFDKEFHNPESWEANIYRNKLFKKIAPILPFCRVCILWDKHGLLEYKDSPTDKGKDVLLQLLDEKVEIELSDLKVLDDEIGVDDEENY